MFHPEKTLSARRTLLIHSGLPAVAHTRQPKRYRLPVNALTVCRRPSNVALRQCGRQLCLPKLDIDYQSNIAHLPEDSASRQGHTQRVALQASSADRAASHIRAAASNATDLARFMQV